MANKVRIEIKGRQFRATDVDLNVQYINEPIDNLKYMRTSDDDFAFFNREGIVNLPGVKNTNRIGTSIEFNPNTTPPEERSVPYQSYQYAFVDIVDENGAAYVSADILDDFLAGFIGFGDPAKHGDLDLNDGPNPHNTQKGDISLGNVENTKVNLVAVTDPTANNDSVGGYSVLSRWANVTTDNEFVCLDATPAAAVWIKTTVPEIGIEGFFTFGTGDFDSIGGTWVNKGFINNIPVVLYTRNATRKAVFMFYAINRALFTAVDPIVQFIVWSEAAPVVTTGDGIRWQLEARYIAQGEAATKAVDETILQTQILTDLAVDTKQAILEFTLDRTLISNGDDINLVLSRIGADGADNYNDSAGVGQSGIVIQVRQFNT